MKMQTVMRGMVAVGLLTLPCLGQTFKSGFMAGMGLSQWTGSEAKILDDKTKAQSNVGVDPSITSYPRYLGITGGVQFCVEWNRWVALQSELSFSRQGNTWEGTAEVARIINGVNDTVTANITVEQRLSYFSLPVLVAFKPHFGRVSPMVYAGPSFGFNCFAENANTVEGGKNTVSDIKYLSYNKNNRDLMLFNMQVCGGAGIGCAVSDKYELVLDARYSQGLTDVVKDTKITTSSIAVTLGVMVRR